MWILACHGFNFIDEVAAHEEPLFAKNDKQV